MDSKALSDVASGIFRLRMDDPHMTNSTIVDVHDDDYTTLTTVEVRSGAVVLHCLASWDQDETEDSIDELDAEDEEEEDEEEEKESGEEKAETSGSDDDEEDDDEDEEDDDEEPGTKTYTIASGNSVTVRATTIRLEPVGMETAEGVYRVQMMKSVD